MSGKLEKLWKNTERRIGEKKIHMYICICGKAWKGREKWNKMLADWQRKVKSIQNAGQLRWAEDIRV